MASWDGSALTLTWPLPPAFPTPTEGSIRFCSSSSAGSSPHFLPCKCCQFSGLQPHPFALFTLHLPGASFTLTVCIPHLYQRLSCRPSAAGNLQLQVQGHLHPAHPRGASQLTTHSCLLSCRVPCPPRPHSAPPLTPARNSSHHIAPFPPHIQPMPPRPS